jgi:TetR/AcrR family transcriptional regulator, transcriptional repressor for nem operon
VVLEQARRDGEVRKATDCAEWAAFLWTGWEGAVLRAKLERKAAPLQMFARLFRQSIGA